MKIWILNIIVIILLIAGVARFSGCEACNGPVATNISMKIDELTTWQPKAIAKDPVGFMTYAVSASDEIVLEMKAAQIGTAQLRASTERKIQANATEYEAVKILFSEFRPAYQEAANAESWPTTVREKSYSEEELRNQVAALGKRFNACQTEKNSLLEFEKKLSSHAAQLEERLADTEATRREFAHQLEVIRMDKASADLDHLTDQLKSQVEGLAKNAHFVKMPVNETTVDELLEEEYQKSRDLEFSELLSMPLE